MTLPMVGCMVFRQSLTFSGKTGCFLQNFVVSKKQRSGGFSMEGKSASGCWNTMHTGSGKGSEA